ncbi:MAG: Gfo/Idh/MocA family oxidoreductase [Leptospiraceae bacterium]|nr:Gfo/Idh/MocA family oxidoreductase [Leptospiraceae bacterium]
MAPFASASVAHVKEWQVAILGAGDRGSIYAGFLSQMGARICAIVDRNGERSAHLASRVSVQAVRYPDWKDLVRAIQETPGSSKESDSREGCIKRPDAVVIALPDPDHLEPCLAFFRMGISVLLEKPAGLSISQLDRLQRQVLSLRKKKNRAAIVVCHVLRYSDFFGKIKGLLKEGAIGEVRSIFHAENVSYYHFAHSYVRGNWKDSRTSSPVLLAKCSHDFDLLGWFAESEFRSVHCSGGQTTFLPRNAPPGATLRCTDGCPHSSLCLFDARSTYIEGLPLKRELARSGLSWISLIARAILRFPGLFRRLPGTGRLWPWPYWPTSTIVSGALTEDSVLQALRTGPYGRCVYHAGSNQPDHCDTTLEFENGITAIMRLNGNSFQEARTIRIDGTEGTLEGRFGQGGDLRLHLHRKKKAKRIPVQVDPAGHLKEDRALCQYFVDLMAALRAGHSDALPEADRALHQVIEGHRMALLAEKSRTTGKAIFR